MRDEMGYVYGHIPASDGCENCPKIGLVSHMDTSPDVSGANVKPQIIKFDGTNAGFECHIFQKSFGNGHFYHLRFFVGSMITQSAEFGNRTVKFGGISVVSHMDTSPDVSGANVKPQIIKFDGTNAPMVGDEYIGRELIVTDHTTLLGADDKAGVAEIVALCAEINANENIRHGALSICFTPDEEIGCGGGSLRFCAL